MEQVMETVGGFVIGTVSFGLLVWLLFSAGESGRRFRRRRRGVRR